jgi:hypothetical protein
MLLRPSTTALAPSSLTPVRCNKFQAALGRAGDEQGLAALHHQPADVDRVEAVHVLLQADRAQDRLFVQVLGQRQLHQDAVDGRVGVQLAHQPFHFLLRGGSRELVAEALHAHLDAVFALHADVSLGRRVFAHEHGGQARPAAGGGEQLIHACLDLGADVGGDGGAIDQCCGHANLQYVMVLANMA